MATRKGKLMNLRVRFLDGTLYAFQVPVKAEGYYLWDSVVRYLQLVEVDYFDLEYINKNQVPCWLDKEKQVLKQIPTPDTPLRFCVKFYTPDPSLLQDEYTRYMFAQQIKQDLALGNIPCSENTASLLASYIVQAELGDYIEEEYLDHSYLSNFKLLPNQTPEVERNVMEFHKNHIGESPSEAEISLLDTVRKVDLYGIQFYQAKDHDAVPLNLSVAHTGLLVFQNQTKINTFSWAIIRKLSFKRKKFLIKLHQDSCGYYKDTVEFYFLSRDECKSFWKRCIEHHAFYRCHDVKRTPKNKKPLVSRGSSFRYSGRTQRQLTDYMRSNFVKKGQFERSMSGRVSSCRSASTTPRIPTKSGTMNSSSEFHVSQNSTASSGSHIIDVGGDLTEALPATTSSSSTTRIEMAHIHSDSSLSGSRSLGTPIGKMQHTQSVDEGQLNHRDLAESGDDLHTGSPRASSPHEAPFYLGDDRKFSESALYAKYGQNIAFEQRLSRCDEVVNIPERVQVSPTHGLSSPAQSPHRSHKSLAASPSEPSLSYDGSFILPPPPSPPQSNGYADELPLPSPPYTTQPSTTGSPPPTYTEATKTTTATPSVKSVSCLSGHMSTDDSLDDSRRRAAKKYPTERSYYIAKELLMTERTYLKNLEVATLWFRNAMTKEGVMPDFLMDLLYANLDPIYDFHTSLLKDIDNRLTLWESKGTQENGEYQKIGDVLLSNIDLIDSYKAYLHQEEETLMEIETACRKNKAFDKAYKEFESQKVCYLPLNTFLLKPAQRLLHYKLLLERLIKHYTPEHPDFLDCKVALSKISEVINTYRDSMHTVDNIQKLIELQRDLVGVDNLVMTGRVFLREGCLQKFSRKGYQQRMFFLFSDMLIYTSRTATPLLQFKVHGQLPLRGMIIEDTDNSKMAVAHSFTIYGGNRCLLVAAGSQEEKDKWIEDLNEAIQIAKSKTGDKLHLTPLKSTTSSENMDGGVETDEDEVGTQIQHRANTTMHVCWHRNTSVSARDQAKAIRNQLSGYLLRKFKNSNGWQKLWVVFTNFCLFFYKTYQEDFPLASLPLLGYSVTTPTLEDAIQKDHVFKLQFKNHVYFFRAESEYTYDRWVEVINSATSSASRTRVFSRLESNN